VTGAAENAVTVRVPEQHALPTPGAYQALVCGKPERVTVMDGGSSPSPASSGVRLLCVEHPLHCETAAPDSVEVDFLDRAEEE
jgi:hypothetical protein